MLLVSESPDGTVSISVFKVVLVVGGCVNVALVVEDTKKIRKYSYILSFTNKLCLCVSCRSHNGKPLDSTSCNKVTILFVV